MALSTYGVKYRLEYSQVEGRKWRLDILKDGYASSVIDLTAQGEPFKIDWLGEDDSISGVIGSVANINLFQETGQDLSEFYTADEQEFLVQLYYFDGVDYVLYWKGFIIQDEYIEFVTSEPFEVNLKASDGLGLVSDYKCDEIVSLNDQPTPFEFIKDAVDLIGLEFDFYDCSEFAESSIGDYTTSSAFTQVRFNAESFLSNPSDSTSWVDVNTALDSIAKSFNCRIFQSKGALYAQNVSTSASAHTDYKALVYDYSGSSWSAETIDKRVFDVQAELDPLNNDLIRRQSNAKKFYTRNYKINPRNCFYNGDFELGSQGITANSNFSVTTSQAQNGDNAAEFAGETAVSNATFDAASTATKTSTTGYTILEFDTNVATYQNLQWDSIPAVDAQISFWYYVNEVAASSSDEWRLRYSLEYQGTYYQFNDGYSNWDAAFDYDSFVVAADEFQQWRQVTFNVSLSVGAGSDDSVTFRIHSPGPSSSVDLIFDDFRMITNPEEYVQSVYNTESKYLTTNSRQLDGSNTSGRINEELLVGASSFGTYSSAGTDPTVTLDETLAGVVYGQYYKASTIASIPELVEFDWRGDPRVSPDARALDLWCMIQNSELYIEPNKRYEGTFRDNSRVDESYALADDVSSNWTEITADTGTSFDFDTFTFTFEDTHVEPATNTQRSGNILSLTSGQTIKIDATSGSLTNQGGNELRLRLYLDGGGNVQTLTWTETEASTNKQVTYEVVSSGDYYLEAEAYSPTDQVGLGDDLFEFTEIKLAVEDKPYSMFDLFNINFNTLSETNNHACAKLSYATKANRLQIYGFELQPVPNVLTLDYSDVKFRKSKL